MGFGNFKLRVARYINNNQQFTKMMLTSLASCLLDRYLRQMVLRFWIWSTSVFSNPAICSILQYATDNLTARSSCSLQDVYFRVLMLIFGRKRTPCSLSHCLRGFWPIFDLSTQGSSRISVT